MASVQLESLGFEIGSLSFPPFLLRGGEAITLYLPMHTEVDQQHFVQCLIGRQRPPGLVIHASVLLAMPAKPSSSWLGWLRSQTPFDWLRKNTPLNKDQIHDILNKHELERNLPLSNYAGTPRALLGLEKAYALGAEVVIFSTSGLDPLGFQRVFRTVEEHLPECSAIYMAPPYLCQGIERHNQFPGSLCLAVGEAATI